MRADLCEACGFHVRLRLMETCSSTSEELDMEKGPNILINAWKLIGGQF